MSIIYVMIPLALALVGLAVWALVWAVRSGQFDELESHGWTPVLDDDERPPPEPSVADPADRDEPEGKDRVAGDEASARGTREEDPVGANGGSGRTE